LLLILTTVSHLNQLLYKSENALDVIYMTIIHKIEVAAVLTVHMTLTTVD
jgi:hypothetical protein